jgi:hypothetical protein
MKTDRDSPSRKKAAKPLPEPGRKKKDPREADKLLDEASKESMIASDPPAISQPDVHDEPSREPSPSQKPDEKKH